MLKSPTGVSNLFSTRDMARPELLSFQSVISFPGLFDIEDNVSCDYMLGEALQLPQWAFQIDPIPDRVILELFENYENILKTPMPMSIDKRSIIHHLGGSILEVHEGDIERRIEKLLGPSDVDVFTEFLGFVVQCASNNMLGYYQNLQIVRWITSHESFLQKVSVLRLPAVQACLDSFLRSTELAHGSRAFTVLVNADIDHNLYGGRREELMLTAVRLGLVDLVKTFLEEGIAINTDWGAEFLANSHTSEVARVLLNSGLRINMPSSKFAKIICSAAGRGQTDLFRTLINTGKVFDPNFRHPNHGWTLLFCAIQGGAVEIVNLLIAMGAECLDELQRAGLFYGTDLQHAAFSGSTEIVKALLLTPSCKRVLQVGRYRWPPLRDAAAQGYIEIVELLINAGAQVNASSPVTKENLSRSFGLNFLPSTPLLAAVEGGHTEVVRVLLRSQVDINVPTFGRHGTNVLEVAEALGHHGIARLLLEAGAIADPPRSSQHQAIEICFAAANANFQRAQHLVDNGVDISHVLDAFHFDRTSWRLDPLSSWKNILSTLLNVCVNKNVIRGPLFHRSVLEIAIGAQEFIVAQELIRAGASLESASSRYGSILKQAINAIGSSEGAAAYELVSLVLKEGGKAKSLEMDGEDPIQIVAYWENLTITRLLLTYQTDVTAPHSTRHAQLVPTALQVAALGSSSNIEVIKLLLESGSDVNSPPSEHWGRTALQAAVSNCHRSGNLEMIQILLDKGASVNAPPAREFGITALQGAAIRGNVKICHLLLERGADPNAAGSAVQGRTALEGAAENGRLDVVQLLLNAGAQLSQSAVDYAEKERHFAIADMLMEKMKESEDSLVG